MPHRALLPGLLALAGLLGSCRAGEPSGDSPPPDLLATIVAEQARHAQVSGVYRYRNVRADDPESGRTHWTGRFAFARPDRYRIRLAEAGEDGYEEYRSDGTWHWKIVRIDPEMEPVVTRLPVAEADQQWRRIARFILFDRALVEADFALQARALDPGAEEALVPTARAEVVLTPTTDAMRRYLRSVQVQFGTDHRVVAVRIRDNSDNLMTVVIDELDYQTPVPEARFRWGTAPAGGE